MGNQEEEFLVNENYSPLNKGNRTNSRNPGGYKIYAQDIKRDLYYIWFFNPSKGFKPNVVPVPYPSRGIARFFLEKVFPGEYMHNLYIIKGTNWVLESIRGRDSTSTIILLNTGLIKREGIYS